MGSHDPSKDIRHHREVSSDDRGRYQLLMEAVYSELRRLAAHYLRSERTEHTLQPTALVHEAFLRLDGQANANWQNRSQFFAVAAQMMRRVLVDHARAKGRSKRGGDVIRLSLDAGASIRETAEDHRYATTQVQVDLIDLDRALHELSHLDEELVRIVEFRYFGGLTIEETASAMDVSPATIKRGWAAARAWLLRRLESTG